MYKILATFVFYMFTKFFIVGLCAEEETNLFYYTLSRSNILFGTPIPTNVQEIARIRSDPESWSAEYYPEGNWGDPMEGHQISLRMEKAVYAVGEAVNAIVLIRNVSLTDLEISDKIITPPIKINITDAQGRSLSEKIDWRTAHGSSRSLNLRPRSQLKYQLNLNSKYELATPGTYYLNAVFGIRTPDGAGWMDITSQTAFFTIMDNAPMGSNAQIPLKTDQKPSNTNISGLRHASKHISTGEASYNTGITPDIQAQSTNTSSNGTIAEATLNAPTMGQTRSTLISENTWRDKLLWGTLSFMFLVLAFILYRAHRRSVHSKG